MPRAQRGTRMQIHPWVGDADSRFHPLWSRLLGGSNSTSRAADTSSLCSWGFIPTQNWIFLPSLTLCTPPQAHQSQAVPAQEGRGGSSPSGAQKELRAGFGICHPEPPPGAHRGFLGWVLTVQRVWKGTPDPRLAPGDGGHGQGFVATSATAPHQGCFQGPISHLLSQLLKVPFASLCQSPGKLLGASASSVCTGAQGDTAWKHQEGPSFLAALFASSPCLPSLPLFRFPSAHPHP